MGYSEVYKKFHPNKCPRNVTVGVTHYPNEASRWYCGPINGRVFCSILGRSANFEIDLLYDDIIGLTCLSSCGKCPKPKLRTVEEPVYAEPEIFLGFNVTKEYDNIKAKQPSTR